MEKYKKIISDIQNISHHDGDGNPWYSNDFICPGFDELKKKFPNVSFKKDDFFTLQKIWKDTYNNDKTILDLADSSYGYSFYDTHGHTKTQKEDEEYKKAKDNKPAYDLKWENAIYSFFTTCEILNGDKDLNSCDIEKDAFQTIINYGLKLRPNNPIYSQYFDTYKKYNETKSNNEKLLNSNISIERKLNEQTTINKALTFENDSLKQEVSKLRTMLNKTIDFCNKVKESRFGKFFFKKQIKALPSPEIENDKER